MASPAPSQASAPWALHGTAQEILIYAHFACPIALLVFFLIAFTVNSIVTAPKESSVTASTEPKGPGGKPLPKKKGPKPKAGCHHNKDDFSPARKGLFNWIVFGSILTFVGNAVVVIAHAIVDREDGWWCGQHVAVCCSCPGYSHKQLMTGFVRSTSSPVSPSTVFS